MIDIQGLIAYNPKTKEYLIRIGNLLFPFKTANEVLAYFLGKFKITKKLRESLVEAKTTNVFSFFLSHIYLSSYLANYGKSLNIKTQNTPKRLSLIFFRGVLCE